MGTSPKPGLPFPVIEKEICAAFLRAYHAKKRALIISGAPGTGKTTSACALTKALSQMFLVAGVVSPQIRNDGETVGYLVRDLRTGKELLLATLSSFGPAGKSQDEGFLFRRFFFFRKALEFANAALKEAVKEADVIVVDEVGPLELSGDGFYLGLQACLGSPAFLVLTVRLQLVGEVQSRLGLVESEVFSLPER